MGDRAEQPEFQLVSTCKPDKISSIFSSFDSAKAELLKSIGFDGLLNLPPSLNLNLDLCLWLYQRLDHKKSCLHLDRGIDLYFKNAYVYLILGIPFQGHSVHFALSQSKNTVNAFNDKLFVENTSPSLTMSFLEHTLTKQYPDGFTSSEIDAFHIASVLYSVSYLLAPELKHQFPLFLIKNFIPYVKPKDINWAELVIWTLARAAGYARMEFNNRSKEITMFGCSLFLQIFYLDNLNFGPSSPYHTVLPRASAYRQCIFDDLILSDSTRLSDDKLMQFGRTEVRHPADVCYTRGWLDHYSMHKKLERTSPEDYIMSIEMLSEGFQILEKFAAHLDDLPGEEPLVVTKNSYIKFVSKYKSNIHELSTKAADLIKRRNISLYHEHIPDHVPYTSQKRFSIGTCNVAVPKKSKYAGPHSPLEKKIRLRTAWTIGPPNAPHVSPTSDYSGQANDAASSSSNIETTSQLSCPLQLPFYRKLVASHSNFPTSTFDISFTHSDVSRLNKIRSYQWITKPDLSWDELHRYWIDFDVPRPLVVPGHVVQDCLKLNGTFTVGLVDAIMLLWDHLDAQMYNHFQRYEETHKRWRHFLPASFAEIVLAKFDYLNSEVVRSCFIGEHIHYKVENCQMVILPVFVAQESWSCYFWDFKCKTVTVLDPLLMKYSADRCKEKHEQTLLQLHKALIGSIRHFFAGWHVKYSDWNHVYATNIDTTCRDKNSGVYAIHYARAYNGEKMAFKLRDSHQGNLSDARGEIAYHIFTCPHNKGFKSVELLDSLDC